MPPTVQSTIGVTAFGSVGIASGAPLNEGISPRGGWNADETAARSS